MTGSHKMTRHEIVAALRHPPPGGDYVWDGANEDDRPLTAEELQQARDTLAPPQRGRPKGSSTKEQVAIRIDRDVLAAFRAGGPGWQTRMNDALKDWLRSHSPA